VPLDLLNGTLRDGTKNNIVITQISTANDTPAVSTGQVLYSFDIVVGNINNSPIIIEDVSGFKDPFGMKDSPVATNISGTGGQEINGIGSWWYGILYYPLEANAGGPYQISPEEGIVLMAAAHITTVTLMR